MYQPFHIPSTVHTHSHSRLVFWRPLLCCVLYFGVCTIKKTNPIRYITRTRGGREHTRNTHSRRILEYFCPPTRTPKMGHKKYVARHPGLEPVTNERDRMCNGSSFSFGGQTKQHQRRAQYCTSFFRSTHYSPR